MTGPSSRILAIESSCDETAAALVMGRSVLAERVATQGELHERFGGVVPEIASRRHLELVDLVIADVLAQVGAARLEDAADVIAVTQGPGLIGALLVGVAAAKSRAWATGLPLIAVDHLLGHVASALLAPVALGEPSLEPPFLCVLVSGGHTLVLDVDEQLGVTMLGSTRDDAAGEAFDKGARLLGLGQPGGPAVAQLAARASIEQLPGAVEFTPAMVHHASLDTSFSGIKTALSVAIREREQAGVVTPSDAQLAYAYETAIVETIAGMVGKLIRSRGVTSQRPDARDTVALVGGVAANERLRERMTDICRQAGMRCVATPLRYCGDNAVMIGVAAGWCAERHSADAIAIDAYATSSLLSAGRLVPN